MHIFETFTGDRVLAISGPDPIESVSAHSEPNGDLVATVGVLGPAPWSFVAVVHSDDTVTKPLSAADYAITVTR